MCNILSVPVTSSSVRMSVDELLRLKEGLNAMSIGSAEQTYECIVCRNTCLSPIQLTAHYVIVHRLIACETCLFLFSERADLDKHERESHADRRSRSDSGLADGQSECSPCYFCDLVPDDLTSHLKTVHKTSSISSGNFLNLAFEDDTFHCSLCGDSLKTQQFFIHFLTTHKLAIKYILTSIQSDENVMEALLKNDETDRDRTNCRSCKQTYSTNAPRIFHQVFCETAAVCRKCCRIFANGLPTDHSQTCEGKEHSFCEFCDIEEELGRSKEDHYKQVHKIPEIILENDPKISSKDEKCLFCDKKLDGIDEVIRHYLKFHNLSARSLLRHAEVPEPSSKKRFRTSSQMYRETESTDLEDTLEALDDFDTSCVRVVYSSATDYDSSDSDEPASTTTLGDNSLKCVYCRYKTGIRPLMAEHLHSSHGFATRRDSLRCSSCNKAFSKMVNLTRHFKTVHHRRDARYQCPFCSFSSRGKWNTRSHIDEHVEASYHPCTRRDVGFSCKYCHQIFWLISKLNEHIFNRHTDEFERDYLMCSFCAATFFNKTSLRFHQSQQHPTFEAFAKGALVWQCIFCKTTFADEAAIRSHFERFHPRFRASFCPKEHCGQRVDDADALLAHAKAKHRAKRFECVECTKVFKLAEFARRHFRSAHESAKRIH